MTNPPEPGRRGRPARQPLLHSATELKELLNYLHWVLTKNADIAVVHRKILAQGRNAADPRLNVYVKVQTFRKIWQDATERGILPSWDRLLQPWAFVYGGDDGLREAERLYDAIGGAEIRGEQAGSPMPPRAGGDWSVAGAGGARHVSTVDYFVRLAKAMEGSKAVGSEFDWSVCLLGQDQTEALAVLDRALAGDPETGAGKRVPSGLSYWGLGPTNAWVSACDDPHLVMRRPGRSLQSFHRSWTKLWPHLSDQGYHHVSLGPGTGKKDRIVLEALMSQHPDLLYVPVDMSIDMLKQCLDATDGVSPTMQTFPVNLDFSNIFNIGELRTLMNQLVGSEPILYSLLGNTLANFDDDRELLHNVGELLRPQDRLALELAVTEELAGRERLAWREYSGSTRFKEFVTATLRQNSDISIPDPSEAVRFHGVVEPGHAIRVEVYYDAVDSATILLSNAPIRFPAGDTIRLLLTRKYAVDGIDAMLDFCVLDEVAYATSRMEDGFGIRLMLLAPADRGDSLLGAIYSR